MPQFKPGDKVRRVGRRQPSILGHRIGDTDVVKAVSGDDLLFVSGIARGYAGYYELVEEEWRVTPASEATAPGELLGDDGVIQQYDSVVENGEYLGFENGALLVATAPAAHQLCWRPAAPKLSALDTVLNAAGTLLRHNEAQWVLDALADAGYLKDEA